MQITAMYLDRPKTVVARKIEMPRPAANQVVVKMKAVGVCGSDVHYYETGQIGEFVVRTPLILGHECAGEIAEVGEAVQGLKVGDRVALEPGIPCRHCRYCKTGRYNLCPEVVFMGTPPVDGAFVEYVTHPADFVYSLPEHVTYEQATLFEPLAVGLYAAERGRVDFGENILILGAGPIGLATLEAVRNVGGTQVTVADVSGFRLEKARELGADEVINPQHTDTLTHRSNAYDVVFEAAGNPVTTNQTVRVAAPGGRIVLIGLTVDDEISFATNTVISKGLEVLGVFRYANMYPKLLRMAAKNQLHLDGLITHRFPFSQTEKALQFSRDGKNESVKTVVMFND